MIIEATSMNLIQKRWQSSDDLLYKQFQSTKTLKILIYKTSKRRGKIIKDS